MREDVANALGSVMIVVVGEVAAVTGGLGLSGFFADCLGFGDVWQLIMILDSLKVN